MAIVITLLKSYAIWLYALFAIIAVFALATALRARSEVKQSIFSLEREVARNRVYRSLFIAFMMIVLGGGVFAVTHYVEPAGAPPLSDRTPTATRLLRATPTPDESEYTPTPTPEPTRPRPTRQPVPTEVRVTPTVTRAPAPLCPTPGINLTAPGENARLSGTVQVMGTASIGNFWYYKVEIGVGRDPSSWSVIGDLHHTPVSNGVLESFNTAAFPPGEYSLRLVVVDKTGNFPEPCVVHVTFGG